jgi:hypothetical protein
MSNQQAVEITAKLYKCREQQIFISGEEGFIKTFREWKPAIEAAMVRDNCDAVKALITVLSLVEDTPNNGMLMHVLIAVACEIAEPTVTAKKESTCLA